MENNSTNQDLASKNSLPKIWKTTKKDYKLLKIIGKGSFGTVIKAEKIDTGELVAIKLVENLWNSVHVRAVLREIIILRKLTQMEDNGFTTRIIDIILPPDVL